MKICKICRSENLESDSSCGVCGSNLTRPEGFEKLNGISRASQNHPPPRAGAKSLRKIVLGVLIGVGLTGSGIFMILYITLLKESQYVTTYDTVLPLLGILFLIVGISTVDAVLSAFKDVYYSPIGVLGNYYRPVGRPVRWLPLLGRRFRPDIDQEREAAQSNQSDAKQDEKGLGAKRSDEKSD